jgi:hypothetical protein
MINPSAQAAAHYSKTVPPPEKTMKTEKVFGREKGKTPLSPFFVIIGS